MTDTFALGSHGPVAIRVELGGAPGERQLVFSLTIRGVGAGVVFDTVVEEWELALGLAVLHAPRLVVVTLVAAGLTFIRSGFIFEHPSTIVHRCGSSLDRDSDPQFEKDRLSRCSHQGTSKTF